MSWSRLLQGAEALEIQLGTIHKRRRQFFRIFDTPLPHVGSFLVLSVGNFDQFLIPPPLPIADFGYGRPQTESTMRKSRCFSKLKVTKPVVKGSSQSISSFLRLSSY